MPCVYTPLCPSFLADFVFLLLNGLTPSLFKQINCVKIPRVPHASMRHGGANVGVQLSLKIALNPYFSALFRNPFLLCLFVSISGPRTLRILCLTVKERTKG